MIVRKTFDLTGLQTLRNAVENASRLPISDAGLLALLRGEDGDPSHIRALFGDVSIDALERAGASAKIGMATILEAYAKAKRTVAAANPALDKALSEPW